MPEVDDLGTGRLQYPPHDVDGSIMTIKQAGCGNEADGMHWSVPIGQCFSGRGCHGGTWLDGGHQQTGQINRLETA